jgi:hypothetical protein
LFCIIAREIAKLYCIVSLPAKSRSSIALYHCIHVDPDHTLHQQKAASCKKIGLC